MSGKFLSVSSMLKFLGVHPTPRYHSALQQHVPDPFKFLKEYYGRERKFQYLVLSLKSYHQRRPPHDRSSTV